MSDEFFFEEVKFHGRVRKVPAKRPTHEIYLRFDPTGAEIPYPLFLNGHEIKPGDLLDVGGSLCLVRGKSNEARSEVDAIDLDSGFSTRLGRGNSAKFARVRNIQIGRDVHCVMPKDGDAIIVNRFPGRVLMWVPDHEVALTLARKLARDYHDEFFRSGDHPIYETAKTYQAGKYSARLWDGLWEVSCDKAVIGYVLQTNYGVGRNGNDELYRVLEALKGGDDE